MKSRLVALAAVAAVTALVAAARSPATTAPPPIVNIKITMTDTAFRMSPKRGQRGSLARFILLNVGKRPHTFTLGHERRGTGRQTGFTKSLAPSAQSVLIIFLDYRGAIPYHGSLPVDRSKPGMKGIFTIF